MTAQKRIDHIAIEEDAVLKFQFALIDAMKDAGMTKADLAKALGVSRARVSQLLDSEANPTLKVMEPWRFLDTTSNTLRPKRRAPVGRRGRSTKWMD
jgi:hypothetical protein